MHKEQEAQKEHEKHKEQHFTASDFIRDVVIGMADGLTVPFALAAGLSGTVSATTLIVVAGCAEIAAGSIAMGLGGYLAAKTDEEHYKSELAREWNEIKELPHREREEVADILREWGLEGEQLEIVLQGIMKDEERWVQFMMKHELNLEKPEPKRALNSSLTIGASYIVGGLVPLSPYMLVQDAGNALLASVLVTVLALFAFGFAKGRFTGVNPLKSALQTTLVGSLAAGAAYFLAKWIGA